jgi:hypothetical protein
MQRLTVATLFGDFAYQAGTITLDRIHQLLFDDNLPLETAIGAAINEALTELEVYSWRIGVPTSHIRRKI